MFQRKKQFVSFLTLYLLFELQYMLPKGEKQLPHNWQLTRFKEKYFRTHTILRLHYVTHTIFLIMLKHEEKLAK